MSRFKNYNSNKPMFLFPCHLCSKKHYMQYQDCPECQGRGGGNMLPVSESVCWSVNRCDGCEAYQERYR